MNKRQRKKAGKKRRAASGFPSIEKLTGIAAYFAEFERKQWAELVLGLAIPKEML